MLLKSRIIGKRNEFESLKVFNDEYMWDDSYNMYIAALEEGKIICGKKEKFR